MADVNAGQWQVGGRQVGGAPQRGPLVAADGRDSGRGRGDGAISEHPITALPGSQGCSWERVANRHLRQTLGPPNINRGDAGLADGANPHRPEGPAGAGATQHEQGSRWRGPPNTNKGATGGATHRGLVVEGDKRDSCQGRAAEGLKSPGGHLTQAKDRQSRGPPNRNNGATGGATHRRLVVEGDKRDSSKGPAAEGLKSPAGPPNSGEIRAIAGATQQKQGSRWRGPPTADWWSKAISEVRAKSRRRRG